MTFKPIVRKIAVGFGAFLVLAAVTTLVVIHTDWFRNYVREEIVTQTEDATGGKVDIASFNFDVSHLTAVITKFVIHGNEPANAAPFVEAARVQVNLRLFTSLHQLLDVTYLGIERARVNVIVFPDGRTNIPSPKVKSTSKTSPLETVVDLAIGRFELTNGLAVFDARKQPLNIRANNFHARLDYNILSKGYQGQLELEPVYVVSGRNTPVTFRIVVPVALQKDRIDFHNASISTPVSALSLSGSIDNMNNPRINARVNGHIATVDLQDAANLPLAVNAKGVPGEVEIDANASVSNDIVDVTALRATLGHSNLEGSGRLKDANGKASFEFKSTLALAELSRLAKVAGNPSGTVRINGVAKIDGANNYNAGGNVEAKNVSWQQGEERISNVNLASAFQVDSHGVDLQGLRLYALGGEFAGNVSLKDFARYQVQGNLRNLNIQTAARLAGQKLPYDGSVSGPIDAHGDINAPGTRSIVATAHLTIAPGKHGIPVSGKLNADYNGATGNVIVQNSYIALPHSRLTLDGALGKQLNVALTSRDLGDLLAAVPVKGMLAIALNGGEATFNGTVSGSLASPRITGHLAVNRFSVEGRQFDALAADVAASSGSASVRNGSLARAAMHADFTAAVGLRNWAAPPSAPLTADATITNADLADAMALAGQPPAGYSGALAATAHIAGTVGDPVGTANLQASNGTIANQPFDQIQARVNLADQLVTVPSAFLQAGTARINMTAEFRHPRDSFSTGSVHAHVQGDQIDLAQLKKLNAKGTVHLVADANGDLGAKEFLLTSVNADAAVGGLALQGKTYGDASATVRTNGQNANYTASAGFFGSSVKLTGNTQLVHDYPTTADATLSNVSVDRVLIAVNRTEIPVKGTLAGTAHFAGTLSDPQGSADLNLTRAVVYGEPVDRAAVQATYLARSIDVPRFEVVAGPSRIDMTAHYDHPQGDLQQGAARFNVTSSHIDLARIHNVQVLREGLGGTLDLSANGAVTVNAKAPRLLFSTLDANVSATGIAAKGHNYGDLKLTANTTSGNHLNFALDSDLAQAAIHGRGTAELTGDYPINAQASFSNVAWTHVQDLLGLDKGGPSLFEVLADGQVTVNGPAMKTDQLSGTLQLSRLNLTTLPRPGMGKAITISNQGPVSAQLDRGQVRIQTAHLTGPQTDIQLTGSASLTNQTLDAALNANADIGILQNFDRDIYSAGKVVVATTVHGTFSQPLVNGQVTLQGVSLNYAQAPIGISNANGALIFNGNSARFQNLTAESGGGKVNVTGFVGFANALRFGVRASATNVRVRVQQGVSLNADADIRFTGTTDASVIAGTASIEQVTYSPQSDIGSMLSRAAPPVQSPTAPSPLLDNMKLDIRVRTAPGMVVQSALTQDIQADADLRVRGTASEPAVLGRVTINEGQLVFFGSQYTVETGSISFYNPARIEPILDISLETQAKGVDVTLRVTGPIDNMKLSYTSDPPLQFQEIVSLLASGKTPTSDPTLLANQPQQPSQGLQQMGESAIVSKAVADPVASRLQRVFGVTQFKIDPSFTTGSDVPTARLSLQQRITSNLTFTYVSAIDDPNSTIIRIEWAFNPQFSAVATRDQNGIFSVNFFYKRQFR